MKFIIGFVLLFFSCSLLLAQNETELVKKVKAKLDLVNDYKAIGVMKIDVPFIKAPPSTINAFYKSPNKFTVKKEGGISILPKGGFNTNLNSILSSGKYTVVPAGETSGGAEKIKIVKLLPFDENSDVVVTTLYIDEKNLLIKKSVITTKESGTYEMEMGYGKYSNFGLPDSVVFSFNLKDYKLPKGVTIEYESGEKKSKSTDVTNKKGKVIVTYSSYSVNKGIPDSMFN